MPAAPLLRRHISLVRIGTLVAPGNGTPSGCSAGALRLFHAPTPPVSILPWACNLLMVYILPLSRCTARLAPGTQPSKALGMRRAGPVDLHERRTGSALAANGPDATR